MPIISAHGTSGQSARVSALTLVAASPMISTHRAKDQRQYPIVSQGVSRAAGPERDRFVGRVQHVAQANGVIGRHIRRGLLLRHPPGNTG
jgi:hypothetical protein